MTRAYIIFTLAGALFTSAFHIFLGGAEVARPLLDSDLDRPVTMILYNVWQGVTVTLLMLAALSMDALINRRTSSLFLVSALSACCGLLALIIIAAFGLSFTHLPHWLLFFAMTTSAWLGVGALRRE